MKDKIFEVLQRIGRSFMLPIAILPVAGLLLGLGSSFTNETTIATYHLGGILGNGTILHALLVIMNKVYPPPSQKVVDPVRLLDKTYLRSELSRSYLRLQARSSRFRL